MALNLHDILPRSRANGPGVRLVIWFQGCTLRCPGCFNPETHSHEPRLVTPVGELLDRIAAEQDGIEGITISGGEPLDQPEGLLELLAGLRRATRRSVVLFSGHTKEEIRAMPLGPAILGHLDVLIAGRYDRTQPLGRGLLASANQQVHLLTDRYGRADIEQIPAGEVVIGKDGSLAVSGIGPPTIAAHTRT
jgi:anaerobic ribonucleoside-triphosphate reductase activating protein